MRLEKGGSARLTSSRSIKLLIGASVVGLLIFFFARDWGTNHPRPGIPDVLEEVAIFETEHGRMVWRFFPQHAPITVANAKKMITAGHYNNSHFYRAQRQFCLQGGLWNLREAPFPPFKLEYKLPNRMGFISMARSSNPDSATSEFSIMLRDNSHWLSPSGSDRFGYAVFAQITQGWDVVQKIMTLPTRDSGRIEMLVTPVKIKEAYLTRMIIPGLYEDIPIMKT